MPPRATQPEPSTPSPQAVPSTRTTLRLAARTSGSRAIRAVGGATSALGPLICGKGSKRASALSSRPDGGSVSFSAWMIWERWIVAAQLARARRLERHRAGDPPQHEARAGDQHGPADAVEEAERRPEPAPQLEAEHLEAGREDAADQEGSAEREQRRIGRARPVLEDERAHARTQERATDEPELVTSAPTTRPWEYPQRAMSTVNATMIQSRTVMRGTES